jgi:hypothetical protein
VATFSNNVISLSDLTHYGISTSETSFTDIHNANGLLYKLISDLSNDWIMYNGNNISGNELIDSSTSSVITKRFFTNIFPTNGYNGSANYTNILGGTPQQHVAVVETTNELLNGQPFRIRFEYDERPRLYNDDVEFDNELIQTNIKLQSMGYGQYIIGDTITDGSYMVNEGILSSHIGYTFNNTLYNSIEFDLGSITTFPAAISTPGNIYINIISDPLVLSVFNESILVSLSIGDNKDNIINNIVNNININTNLITVGVVATRIGDKLVINTVNDFDYINTNITNDPLSIPTISGLNIGIGISGVLIDWKKNVGIPNPMYGWLKVNTSESFGLLNDGSIGGVGSYNYNKTARTYGQLVDVSYKEVLIPGSSRDRSYVIRNKIRGNGWFKPHLGLTSYRLTMTERGLGVSLYHDAPSVSADDQSWFVIQRTVDSTTGVINPSSAIFETNPVHCLYSCSSESIYPSDLNEYYTTNISTLQTPNNSTLVYDKTGTQHNLYSLTNPNINYGEVLTIKVDGNDLDESHIIDDSPKDVWRFVVREIGNITPWPVHILANQNGVDSESIINSGPQHSITESNTLVINFPTKLTTGRCVYPNQELDLFCFTSANVVADASITPIPRYSFDGANTEVRKYCGLRSSLSNGDGMRIMILVRSDYIFNSDIPV